MWEGDGEKQNGEERERRVSPLARMSLGTFQPYVLTLRKKKERKKRVRYAKRPECAKMHLCVHTHISATFFSFSRTLLLGRARVTWHQHDSRKLIEQDAVALSPTRYPGVEGGSKQKKWEQCPSVQGA